MYPFRRDNSVLNRVTKIKRHNKDARTGWEIGFKS